MPIIFNIANVVQDSYEVIKHNYKYFCKENNFVPYQNMVDAFSQINEETALVIWKFLNVMIEKAETPKN